MSPLRRAHSSKLLSPAKRGSPVRRSTSRSSGRSGTTGTSLISINLHNNNQQQQQYQQHYQQSLDHHHQLYPQQQQVLANANYRYNIGGSSSSSIYPQQAQYRQLLHQRNQSGGGGNQYRSITKQGGCGQVEPYYGQMKNGAGGQGHSSMAGPSRSSSSVVSSNINFQYQQANYGYNSYANQQPQLMHHRLDSGAILGPRQVPMLAPPPPPANLSYHHHGNSTSIQKFNPATPPQSRVEPSLRLEASIRPPPGFLHSQQNGAPQPYLPNPYPSAYQVQPYPTAANASPNSQSYISRSLLPVAEVSSLNPTAPTFQPRAQRNKVREIEESEAPRRSISFGKRDPVMSSAFSEAVELDDDSFEEPNPASVQPSKASKRQELFKVFSAFNNEQKNEALESQAKIRKIVELPIQKKKIEEEEKKEPESTSLSDDSKNDTFEDFVNGNIEALLLDSSGSFIEEFDDLDEDDDGPAGEDPDEILLADAQVASIFCHPSRILSSAFDSVPSFDVSNFDVTSFDVPNSEVPSTESMFELFGRFESSILPPPPTYSTTVSPAPSTVALFPPIAPPTTFRRSSHRGSIDIIQLQPKPFAALLGISPASSTASRSRASSCSEVGLLLDQSGHSMSKFKDQLYKTEMCRNVTEFGVCQFGENCRFAHSEEEVRHYNEHKHVKYKTQPCTVYEEDICYYGKRCWFIHKSPDTKDPVEELAENFVDMFFDPRFYDVMDKCLSKFLRKYGLLAPADVNPDLRSIWADTVTEDKPFPSSFFSHNS